MDSHDYDQGSWSCEGAGKVIASKIVSTEPQKLGML